MGGEAPSPQHLRRALSFSDSGGTISEEALTCVFHYIEDPRDRASISLACRRWHRIDSITRKHVTVAFCYTASPGRLARRFPRLESLKLKGKPRAAMYNLIPWDWGGCAKPWIRELAAPMVCLKEVHLRRMVVDDEDLGTLVGARGFMLLTLKLDKCSGFSTDALRAVARSCRVLRTLYLEESEIEDKGGEWLRELAMNNSVLTTLNFYSTDLAVNPEDLELLAKSCKSLVSLKISDSDIHLSDLIGFFKAARALEEFGGGLFSLRKTDQYEGVPFPFPPKICCLGLSCFAMSEMPLVYPLCSHFKKLDLQFALLSTEEHCLLISKCPNLIVLEAIDAIGDRGLQVVGETCKRLRRLRIERGADEPEMQEEQGRVTQIGITAIAVNCRELEYIAVYVADITNGALESIGTFWTNLRDFRMCLLDREVVPDLPLDNGVRALLRGCTKLKRFAFYVRPGALTDVGLAYIGQFSGNITYMLLGNVGETDDGIISFARGCKKLQKLELRGSFFSEAALATAVLLMPCLKYMWVQGFKASQTGFDLLHMARPYWNIEFTPSGRAAPEEPTGDDNVEPAIDGQAQILSYYSLAGRRPDCPQYVVTLHPE